MALRKWSVIEDELKRNGVNLHPNVLKLLGEYHERMREQHQQMMQVVEFVDKNTDLMQALVSKFGAAATNLEKLGLKDKMREIEGDPDETGSTYHEFRDGKKN
jgi:hypothetical protein